MKKIILFLIILSFLVGSEIFAQMPELVSPGILPDSPFYFLDILGEKIGLFFSFNDEKKANKAINYANEKTAEAGKMIEKNKIKPLEKAAQKYQNYLDYAYNKTEKVQAKKSR